MAWTDNLVAHWKLDEESGDRADAHGTNTLVDVNTVGYAAGKLGNAASLVPANEEYFSLADNAAISPSDDQAWTIAAWVYWTGEFAQAIVLTKSNSYTDADRAPYAIRISSSGVLAARVGNNSVGGGAVWTSALTENTWHFVVAWHDPAADTINIQVDGGTPVSESHEAGTYDNSTALTVGAISTGSFLWSGRLDSISLWFRVLTSDERTALYNSGAGLDYPFTGGATVHNVTGACDAVSACAGTPTVIRTVTGDAAAVSTAAGAVTVIRTASGACAAVSAVAGAVTLIRSVMGSCAAVSSVAGDAQIVAAGVHSVAGSCVSVSSAAGAVTLVRTVSGSCSAASTAAGSVTVIRAVSGSCSATSTCSGDAQLIAAGVHAVSGSCIAVSAAAGTVTVIRTVTGNCVAVSACAGSAHLIGELTGFVNLFLVQSRVTTLALPERQTVFMADPS